MLYRITHLKARQWPVGALVGDVIDLPKNLPGWALGKCEPAPGAEAATVAFPLPPEPAAPAPAPRDALAEVDNLAGQLVHAQGLIAEAFAKLNDMAQRLDAVEADKAALRLQVDAMAKAPAQAAAAPALAPAPAGATTEASSAPAPSPAPAKAPKAPKA